MDDIKFLCDEKCRKWYAQEKYGFKLKAELYISTLHDLY